MTRRRWIADEFTETTAALTGAQALHLARVLRVLPGAEHDIVAGDRVFRAVVERASDQRVEFSLVEELSPDQALDLTLICAVFKFDRMEWAIEKATELGVRAIQPVIAHRTDKHLAQAAEKRADRWRRIAREAAQQSRRSSTPQIAAPLPLRNLFKQSSTERDAISTHQQADVAPSPLRIVLSEMERTVLLPDLLAASDHPLAIAVGPEGGWTEQELALFSDDGWHSASLGPRILRAETAAIAAVAIAGSA